MTIFKKHNWYLLYTALSSRQRRVFVVVLLMAILVAFAEMVGVIGVAPFVELAGNVEQLDQVNDLGEPQGYWARAYHWSGLETKQQFVMVAAGVVMGWLFLSLMLALFSLQLGVRFAHRVGRDLMVSRFAGYLHKDWLFHSQNNSAHLLAKVGEVQRIQAGILQPFVVLICRGAIGFAMVGVLLYTNWKLTLMAVGVFVPAYIILYKFMAKSIQHAGQDLTESSLRRNKVVSEGFGGIKDVKILGREALFKGEYLDATNLSVEANVVLAVRPVVPRYFIDFALFAFIVLYATYMSLKQPGELQQQLAMLTMFMLASLKLLPAMQAAYRSAMQMKGNVHVLSLLDNHSSENSEKIMMPARALNGNRVLALENVTFAYPGKAQSALEGIEMDIVANQTVGLVGSSGSGKSTLVDLMLGLFLPQGGQMVVASDGAADSIDAKQWHKKIGYVPQSIFLSDGTIAQNVAFGVPEEEIDHAQVIRALHMAHLEQLVDELPEGINAYVGERGVQLSGGQRQRIGIARALYHQPEILVLDEATSALDGFSEKAVMDAIHDFSGSKTIIMIAHRLATVKKCDIIYVLEQGKIVDSGTFEQLVNNNEKFARMAELS